MESLYLFSGLIEGKYIMASSIKYPLASLPKRLLYLCVTTSRIFVMEFDLNHLMYVIKHEPH